MSDVADLPVEKILLLRAESCTHGSANCVLSMAALRQQTDSISMNLTGRARVARGIGTGGPVRVGRGSGTGRGSLVNSEEFAGSDGAQPTRTVRGQPSHRAGTVL